MRWVKRAAAALFLASSILTEPVSAQVLFNEVLVRDGGGSHANQVVELKNNGATSVNIGGWIISHLGDVSSVIPPGVVLGPGSLFVLHFNETGANTANSAYYPGQVLADISDLALYTSNTIANSGFSNPSNIRAFIQWGAVPTNGRQSVASVAGLWTSNTFVPLPPAGHSIELCSGTGVTPSSYGDQPNPTVGANNPCQVKTETVSWSKVKAIFE